MEEEKTKNTQNKTDTNSTQKQLEFQSITPITPQQKAKQLQLTSDRFQHKYISETAEEKMDKIKKKDRTYLRSSEWSKSKYAYQDVCKQLLKNCPQEVETVDYRSCSEQEFFEKFQSKAKPCLIKNMYKQSYIDKYWSFQYLYEKYKDGTFKCGEDDDGRKLKVKLRYYMEYLVHNKDDSPLYLFESSIEDNQDAKYMIKKYDVPKYFTEDIFKYVGEKKRPPYRWFLLGPERSGTTVHQDPLFTDAWNTSFQGYKKWVIFPNKIPKAIVKGKQYKPKGEDDEAINYFAKMLPEIIKNEGRDNLEIQEFIQGPGETVYIPGGMWHAVINLSDTMAVTQNVMTKSNLKNVWRSTRVERKRFACFCLKKFRKNKPEIAELIDKINKEDEFIMYDWEKKITKKRQHDKELKNFTDDELQLLDFLEKKRKYSTDSSNSSSSSSSSEYDSQSKSSDSESSSRSD